MDTWDAKYCRSSTKLLDWLTDLNQVSGGMRNHSRSHSAFHLLKNLNTTKGEKLGFFVYLFFTLNNNQPATFSHVVPQSSFLVRPLGLCSHQSCRIPAAVVLSSAGCVLSLSRSGCHCFAGISALHYSSVSPVAAGSSLWGSSGVFSSSSLDFPVKKRAE